MGVPAVSFNTLRFANRLKSAGVLPEHAEAEAEALAEAFEVNFKELATKEDVKREVRELRKDTETKFSDLRKDMEVKFSDLRKDMEVKFSDLRKDMESKFTIVDAKLIQLEQRVDNKIERAKLDLIKWIVGSMLAQFGLLAGLMIGAIKFLTKTLS
jgi:hypothetical protein